MTTPTYKESLMRDPSGAACCVLHLNLDGSITAIPFHSDNRDYQAYLKWLEEGNTVLPPDEPVND